MTTRKEIKAATEKALKQFEKSLPHIEAARETLGEALGIDPDERPEVDKSEEWEAVRLMQNIWDAHLHVIDPFGS